MRELFPVGEEGEWPGAELFVRHDHIGIVTYKVLHATGMSFEEICEIAEIAEDIDRASGYIAAQNYLEKIAAGERIQYEDVFTV